MAQRLGSVRRLGNEATNTVEDEIFRLGRLADAELFGFLGRKSLVTARGLSTRRGLVEQRRGRGSRCYTVTVTVAPYPRIMLSSQERQFREFIMGVPTTMRSISGSSRTLCRLRWIRNRSCTLPPGEEGLRSSTAVR